VLVDAVLGASMQEIDLSLDEVDLCVLWSNFVNLVVFVQEWINSMSR
jgi:hypothetical protein